MRRAAMFLLALAVMIVVGCSKQATKTTTHPTTHPATQTGLKATAAPAPTLMATPTTNPAHLPG